MLNLVLLKCMVDWAPSICGAFMGPIIIKVERC